MAMSTFNKQVATLRVILVAAYLTLSALAFAGAFLLAWNERQGTTGFLLAGAALAIWASVTATSPRISLADVTHLTSAVRGNKALKGTRVA